MLVKMLEIRDSLTFMPVMTIKPIADNEGQHYLLRRDGYDASRREQCVILIKSQCRDVSYDPYNWDGERTMQVAHLYICEHWDTLRDGDVVDVQFILGETKTPKISERDEVY